MAATADRRQRRPRLDVHLSRFFHAASKNISSFSPHTPISLPSASSKILLPRLFSNSPISVASPSDSAPASNESRTAPFSSPPAIESTSSSISGSGFPSAVKISTARGGGPAFVGQVFSMCDLSGTGLMAVSTHFDIPFISKRTPEWLKKMFSSITKRERNGPVFRFFMDLGDAVSYVKQLDIPSGVVGACRLDIAYEHFKEKPELFQFVPNERQVKEANKLLKTLTHCDGNKKVVGVPVFSAQNLDIAIATTDGIKWYTPYFFDKNMLDNILEESVDQHFHGLIQSRNSQRRREVVDDNLSAEAIEEMGENNWEPLEVQEVLDEMGHSGIPLSVISKAAEIQLLHSVDRILLGNRWIRKVTGIQPKFPYMLNSFEKMTASSFSSVKDPSNLISNSKFEEDSQLQTCGPSSVENKDNSHDKQEQIPDFHFPFGDWLFNPWLNQKLDKESRVDSRGTISTKQGKGKPSPFLPKITMVGVATGEPGKMSKATLKKTMDDLTKELEHKEQVNQADSASKGRMHEERDPLFVANIGDYYSGASKTGSVRWI